LPSQETQQKPLEKRWPRFSPEQWDRLLDSYQKEQAEIDEHLRKRKAEKQK
jgi:hypothetical protein